MATIASVTKDKNGVKLVSCDVFLFKYDSSAHTLTQMDYVVSDGSTGAYSFTTADSDPLYMVAAFKDGTPNVRDVTDHNLQPV
jgi:hypothetical protein